MGLIQLYMFEPHIDSQEKEEKQFVKCLLQVDESSIIMLHPNKLLRLAPYIFPYTEVPDTQNDFNIFIMCNFLFLTK